MNFKVIFTLITLSVLLNSGVNAGGSSGRCDEISGILRHVYDHMKATTSVLKERYEAFHNKYKYLCKTLKFKTESSMILFLYFVDFVVEKFTGIDFEYVRKIATGEITPIPPPLDCSTPTLASIYELITTWNSKMHEYVDSSCEKTQIGPDSPCSDVDQYKDDVYDIMNNIGFEIANLSIAFVNGAAKYNSSELVLKKIRLSVYYYYLAASTVYADVANVDPQAALDFFTENSPDLPRPLDCIKDVVQYGGNRTRQLVHYSLEETKKIIGPYEMPNISWEDLENLKNAKF